MAVSVAQVLGLILPHGHEKAEVRVSAGELQNLVSQRVNDVQAVGRFAQTGQGRFERVDRKGPACVKACRGLGLRLLQGFHRRVLLQIDKHATFQQGLQLGVVVNHMPLRQQQGAVLVAHVPGQWDAYPDLALYQFQ